LEKEARKKRVYYGKKNAGNIYGTIKIRKNWVRIRGMSMVLKLIHMETEKFEPTVGRER
jgi:hypothetical protein